MMKFFKILMLLAFTIGTVYASEPKGENKFVWIGDFSHQNWLKSWQKAGTFIHYSDNFFSIVDNFEDKPYLSVHHKIGSYSKKNKPGSFHFKFNQLSEIRNIALTYEIKFENEFDFGKGGKLPGLCGGIANTGKNIPNGKDGFSIRYMWREKGKLFLYCHLPTSINHGTYFDTEMYLVHGRWHILKQIVTLNTPGFSDGSITVQLDHQPSKTIHGIRFRDVNELKIDGIIFSNFFGGSKPAWKSPKDQKIFFRSFEVKGIPIK